jgi:hypothetical protein
MAHRTTNPTTAFYSDGRETSDEETRRSWSGRNKAIATQAIWSDVFPGKPWPHYYGSTFDAYADLKAAGYKYSARYGWRKA